MNTAGPDLGFFARHSTLRRSVALLLTAVLSTGCMTWRPGNVRPAALIAQHPERVRVSFEQGLPVVLYAPTVAGDSLVGYALPGVEASWIAIPLRNVVLIEVRRPDKLGTWVLAAGITGIVSFFVIVAASFKSPMAT